jgi:F0F1-type ATP synthase assembly protein I
VSSETPAEDKDNRRDEDSRRERQSAWRQVGEYSGLALALPIAAVLGYAAGSWLDTQLGVRGFHIAGLLLGIAAGFKQLVTKALRDSLDPQNGAAKRNADKGREE